MKRLIIFAAFFVLYLSLYKTAHAALFTKQNGIISVNVLGAEDTNGLQVITNDIENIISKINLNIKDNSLVISYDNKNMSDKTFDIKDFDGKVVELKKNTESDSLYVLNEGDNFLLQQRGIVVATAYPIEIGKNLENLTLQTNSGNRYLSVLPYDAVMPLIKTNIIDEINEDGSIKLLELDAGELAYYIQGEKEYNLFDLISLKADISVNVSALSGKVLSVDQPAWSRVLTFLQV